MTIEEIRDLFAYNRWANERMLEAAGALDAERFSADTGSSYPSVAATIAHIIGAEWVWLARWNGESPAALPAEWQNESHAQLVERWRAVAAEQSRFIASLGQERLDEPVTYRNFRGVSFTVPLAVLLQHVVNHSTYHRGQVTTMLRQHGVPAVGTDLVLFHNTRGVRQSAV